MQIIVTYSRSVITDTKKFDFSFFIALCFIMDTESLYRFFAFLKTFQKESRFRGSTLSANLHVPKDNDNRVINPWVLYHRAMKER